MATLNIDTKEFADLVMIWLFDQVVNPEQVTSENLLHFLEKHGTKLKSSLMKYYFDTDPQTRMKYRRISGVFNATNKDIQSIRISPDLESREKDKKEGKLKKLAKAVIKKILTKEELTKEDMDLLIEIEDIEL